VHCVDAQILHYGFLKFMKTSDFFEFISFIFKGELRKLEFHLRKITASTKIFGGFSSF